MLTEGVAVAGRPLIFGEVLFDHFPDGAEVLGGAPVNVAWHLKGFGQDPLLISRVGEDAQGQRVVETLGAWGMDLAALQIDPAHATGQVQVTIKGGQPAFSIVPDQAYDFIDRKQALAAARDVTASLYYHGTLALRGEISRDTHAALTGLPGVCRCVDVNLRPPWTPMDRVQTLLKGAGWAKVNDIELRTICDDQDRELTELASSLRDTYGIDQLVVTLGEDGAMVCSDAGRINGAPVPVHEIRDTVGAGDAFSAVSLLGLLEDWSPEDTLARALAFASCICGVRGATIDDPEVYRDFRARWRG